MLYGLAYGFQLVFMRLSLRCWECVGGVGLTEGTCSPQMRRFLFIIISSSPLLQMIL